MKDQSTTTKDGEKGHTLIQGIVNILALIQLIAPGSFLVGDQSSSPKFLVE